MTVRAPPKVDFAVRTRARQAQVFYVNCKKSRSPAWRGNCTPNNRTDTAPFFLTNLYGTSTSPPMSFLSVVSPFFMQCVLKSISLEWLPWRNRTRTQFGKRSWPFGSPHTQVFHIISGKTKPRPSSLYSLWLWNPFSAATSCPSLLKESTLVPHRRAIPWPNATYRQQIVYRTPVDIT